MLILSHIHLENHCVKLVGGRQKEFSGGKKKQLSFSQKPFLNKVMGSLIQSQFSRGPPKAGWDPHTRQRHHSQFKTTASSSAHLDGRILSAYIIRIGRAESVGRCLGPRDKWRSFQMTDAGQPRPVIPLIATHSSAAFLAAISPGAPILSLNLSP